MAAMSLETGNGFFQETKLFFNIALSSVVCNILNEVQWLISSSYAGKHQGPEVLAAISLTLLGALVTRSFSVGFLSGFDTIAGNYMGAKKFPDIGNLFQTLLLLYLVLWILGALFSYNLGALLFHLNQPKEVVKIADKYLDLFAIIFPAECAIDAIKSFFRCQNVVTPFIFIHGVATVCHYFFVHFAEDTMIAFFMTQYLTLLLCLLLFCFNFHNKQTWTGWNLKEAWNWDRVKELLNLGIPGIFTLSQWWFYDFQTILVGTLGADALAAHSVAYFILPIFFHLPNGTGIASQTRIATLLGEQNHFMAKKVAYATILLNSMIGVISLISAYLLRQQIYNIFIKEDNDAVFEILETMWPLVCSYMLADSILASALGIFKGLSLHALLAKITITCLWFIGVPIELVFLNVLEDGLPGLWMGMNICYDLMAVCFLGIIFTRDYSAASYDIVKQQEELQEEEEQLIEEEIELSVS